MAKDVSHMVSGLGMAMNLIRSLSLEVKSAGGFDEQLHFLTTDRGKTALRKVAACIASIEWRIPKSLIMRLAGEESVKDWNSNDYLAADECFEWGGVLTKLNIPLLEFKAGEEFGAGDTLIPTSVSKQIDGKLAEAGMVVELNGEPHVIVSIGGHYINMAPGYKIEAKKIDWLRLSPARYFDLDR